MVCYIQLPSTKVLNPVFIYYKPMLFFLCLTYALKKGSVLFPNGVGHLPLFLWFGSTANEFGCFYTLLYQLYFLIPYISYILFFSSLLFFFFITFVCGESHWVFFFCLLLLVVDFSNFSKICPFEI